jgi:hypothetical protein
MKKINFYKWLYFIFLLAFILLFSATSFALIPGDFGSAGGGPPDGCVNFEDLMIFAMAYGSTPTSGNWNLLCDIYPDDVIDFEDLMIFAMHYGECEEATWTIMLYVDGDNNLEFWAWDILGMVESVGSSGEVNIIAQIDPYDDCTGTYRYHVTDTEEGTVYPLYPDDIVQSMSEQNMSDPAVLTDFVNWSATHYPAEHYLLVLSDHGAGWREKDEIFKGIIWDDTTGGWEHIDIPELAQSLENTNVDIDILALDACNMQMIEVAHELGKEMTSPPNYLVASENTGWTGGLPYDELVGDLVNNPNMTQLAICEMIVNGYINNLSSQVLPATISALQFNNEFLNNSLGIINNFSTALMDSTYQEEISNAKSTAQAYVLWDRPQYKDLYDFAQIIKNNVSDCQSEAQAVMDLISNIIVAEGHTGPGMDNSYGLSIYLIDSPGEYDSSYDLLQFSVDTQWDEFLLSGEGMVTGVQAIPTTSQVSTGLAPEEALSLPEEENNPLTDYQIANISEVEKGETAHQILVRWDAYYGVDGYRAYRKVNNGDYTMIFEWADPPTGNSGYAFYDPDISEGNTYSYYVTAYGTDWETDPSEIATIEINAFTFLPTCSLISPTDNSIITDTNPVFSWNPVGLDALDLPYGEVYSGNTYLRIYDASSYDSAWSIWFNDMIVSSVTYDQDENANPLIPGHTYRWYIRTYGYDNSGNYIASSYSETWEFNYGNVVPQVDAQAITRQGTSMEMFQEKIDQLVAEGQIQDSYQLNELSPLTKGVTEYSIDVDWHSYPDATGYKVYRSVNGGSYSLVFQDEPTTSWDWYGFYDYDVSEGNTYTYYVTAYGSEWETDPSPEVTIDTWLPPCSLVSPADELFITDPTPTFTWNPVGLTSGEFPYGSIYSGRSNLDIIEEENWDYVWEPYFNDLTTSLATYDQDGQAITPLETGKGYEWQIDSFGYNENGKLIAYSWSEYWDFYYGNVVAQVEAYAITRQGTSTNMKMFQEKIDQLVDEGQIKDSYKLNELPSLTRGIAEYEISVDWHSYPDATGYKVYRSVDGGLSYSEVFQDEPTTSWDWYGFYDGDVSEGNSYTYYVTAYGSGWETDPSSTITIDTWLPSCSIIGPTDESIITDSTPTFSWNPVGLASGDFPYGSIYSGWSMFHVIEDITYDWVWNIYFNDLTTSSATYNQNNQAAALQNGHAYHWESAGNGYDENGKFIAQSWTEYWDFTYSGN